MEAELVRDKTIDAIPIYEEGLTEEVRGLRRDYKALQKRIGLIALVALLVIVAAVVRVILGTRNAGRSVDNSSNNEPFEDDKPDDKFFGDEPNDDAVCLVNLEIECALTDDPGRRCDDIPDPERSCEGPTLAMFLRYTGEPCATSTFLTPDSPLLECTDLYLGGPTSISSVSDKAYIVTTDTATSAVYRNK
jgi:hypothetical protein